MLPAPPLRPDRAALALLALAAAVLSWSASETWWSLVDDAYISARYADLLAHGAGLTYSPGEPPVEGVTNLAFTALLAALFRLGVAPAAALTGLSFAFAVATLPAAWWLTRAVTGRDHPANALPALTWAILPHTGVIASNGLESTMMVWAVTSTLAAWVSLRGARRAVAGALASLLLCVRPEGAAVVATLVGLDLARAAWTPADARREALADLGRAAIPPAVTLAALLGWRWATFHAWAPNTWYAKADFPLTETFQHNAQLFVPESTTLYAMVGAGALGVLLPPYRPAKLAVAATAVALGLIPLTVLEWMPGLRLFAPTLLLVAVMGSAGAASLPARASAALSAAQIAGAVALAAASADHTRAYDGHHTVQPGNGAERAARFLAERLPPGATAAVRDAGNFAFYLGPEVRVAELHQRALTRPHPDGADADVLAYTPVNPEVIVGTVRAAEQAKLEYPQDRKVIARATEPYVYLGRVVQHYRRHYDLWARADLGIDALPDGVALNFAGRDLGPRAKPADAAAPQ